VISSGFNFFNMREGYHGFDVIGDQVFPDFGFLLKLDATESVRASLKFTPGIRHWMTSPPNRIVWDLDLAG